MKLLYLSSKNYPSKKADPYYVRSMAEAFSEVLGGDFLFIMRGKVPEQFKSMNALGLMIPKRMRIAYYLFYLPILVFKHSWSSRDVCFLSYDPYLLAILIFWRQVFGFRYLICSDWHQLFGDWRDRYVSSHSDRLTTTSQRLRNLLISRSGIEPEKIRVAYGGVNKKIFEEKMQKNKMQYREELELPQDHFLVGYVGGFKSVGNLEKGINTMIKSLSYLEDGVMMVFVGGNKQQIEEYKALAVKEGVESKCIFVGWQPFDKLVEYDLSMDVLVIPYPNEPHFRDYGFPMKVWEYMATGRPIIYSNLAIMEEILGGRATSFVAGDAVSLKDAIRTVYRNLGQLEATSRENTHDTSAYTWKARAENILNFINSK